MNYQFKSAMLKEEQKNGFVQIAVFEGDNEIAVVKKSDGTYMLIVFNYGDKEEDLLLLEEHFDELKHAVQELGLFITSEYAGS